MNNSQKIQFICWSTLKVAAFYLLLILSGKLFDPQLYDLYIHLPHILFVLITFFFVLFLCRVMGCLVFLPKDRLKAILRDGQISPTASQIVLRLFSVPFLKRILTITVLIGAEFYLRFISILLFLIVSKKAAAVLGQIALLSNFLAAALLVLAAYVIMELPFYLLFYKFSFKGHPNRMYEYRFGMKLSFFVFCIYIINRLLMPLAGNVASTAGAVLFFILLAVLSTGLWYLMYRKKWTCFDTCPICAKVKSVLCRTPECRREQERKELKDSIEQAEKVASNIIEAEVKEVKKAVEDIPAAQAAEMEKTEKEIIDSVVEAGQEKNPG